jgi:hypothetical protein
MDQLRIEEAWYPEEGWVPDFLGADELPEHPEQPDHDKFLEMFDRQCGASYTTGGHDPYGTDCDQPIGHYPATDHEGDDPFGGSGRVSWRGGGSCAGDALPFTDVHWFVPVPTP